MGVDVRQRVAETISQSLRPGNDETRPPDDFFNLIRRFVVRYVTRLLDAFWHTFAFAIGTFILGGVIANIIVSLIAMGSSGLSDPSTWVIVSVISRDPTRSMYILASTTLLLLLSYVAHRSRHASSSSISLPRLTSHNSPLWRPKHLTIRLSPLEKSV
jgi:hypothetical protein